MRRRDFIAAIGGAVAAWPLAVRGRGAAMPTIGFLDPRFSADSFSDQIAGFHRGLKDVGFVENENVAIEYGWGHDQFDGLPAMAAELGPFQRCRNVQLESVMRFKADVRQRLPFYGFTP